MKGKKGGEKMQGCTQDVEVVQVVGDARLCKEEVEDVVEDKEVVEIGEDARFCTSCRSEKISALPG